MASSYNLRLLLHLIHAILISNLVTQGVCEACPYKDIELVQSKTGDYIDGKPQFMVELFNPCGKCAQSDVKVNCTGFQTVDPFPGELTKHGNVCVVIEGFSINPTQEASFNYAWDTQFPFKILSSTPQCD